MFALVDQFDVLHMKHSKLDVHVRMKFLDIKPNVWLTCHIRCLQMDHASSLAVCYAPMQCQVSDVHSFKNRHSLRCC